MVGAVEQPTAPLARRWTDIPGRQPNVEEPSLGKGSARWPCHFGNPVAKTDQVGPRWIPCRYTARRLDGGATAAPDAIRAGEGICSSMKRGACTRGDGPWNVDGAWRVTAHELLTRRLPVDDTDRRSSVDGQVPHRACPPLH